MNGQADAGPTATARLWSPIALLAVLGGAAVIAGVFLPWADPSRVTLQSREFIEGLAAGFAVDPSAFPIPGGPLTDSVVAAAVPGRADKLGVGAALAGFAAVVGAFIALGMPDARMRRIGGMVAVGAGLAAIAFAGSAWTDASGFAEDEIVTQVRSEAERQLEALLQGIPLSGLITGPILDRVEASLRASLEVEALAATGLFVSLGGGVAAALGGLAVIVRESPVKMPAKDPLQEIAERLSAADRDDLLRVLTTPDETRSAAIQGFHQRPGKETWAPILAELERDQRLRRVVVVSLRAVGERSSALPGRATED